jgi:PAS domain S-box-containing protein
VLPLTGEQRALIALLVFEAPRDRPFSAQDRELGLILASCASEGVRLLQALERLSLSEERLRHIIDASPSLILLLDPVGRLMVANKRLEEWHGCRREDILGKPWQLAFAPAVAELYAKAGLGREEPLEEPVEAEIEVPSGRHAARSALLTVFPVRDPQGRSIGRGAIATDITDYRRAQERLRHARKVEALGRLTGGIAHEFNNLLAVIAGNLDFMRRSMDHDPSRREIIEDALASARSGTDLIRQLLALGRRQALAPKRTDVAKHIQGMMRLLQRTLGENVRIEVCFPSDLWPIEVDRSQLEASLLNLALNARDAMGAAGVLRISAENVAGSVRKDGSETADKGHYVMMTVSDNGSGMTTEVLQQAMEPFFTTKASGHGSGLGLSMVHAFVEQSGGRIELESEVGVGTIVRLYLPALSDPSSPAAAHPAEELSPASPEA